MERKYALIVGNNEFEDPSLACLVSPASEARALAEILQEPGIGGFDGVTALVNEPEVRVRRGIASLFARKSPDDLLLLYFSTHGLLDDNGRLFLAARDTQRDLLQATSIAASFITDEMDNSSSRRQVLILDCWFALNGQLQLGWHGDRPSTSPGCHLGRVYRMQRMYEGRPGQAPAPGTGERGGGRATSPSSSRGAAKRRWCCSRSKTTSPSKRRRIFCAAPRTQGV